MDNQYDIFISYRREGGKDYARTIQQALEKEYKVFLDFDELKDGVFDQRIMDAISHSTVFILLLTKGALDRCVNDDDWVRAEILHAGKCKCHIVPVIVDDLFEGIPECLPSELKTLVGAHQFSEIQTKTLFKASMDQLIDNRIAPYIHKQDLEKGAEIHIESDADCQVYYYQKLFAEIHAGENNVIRLKRGKHKLEFVSVEYENIKTQQILEIPDKDYIDFIEVKMKERVEDERKRREEEIQRREAEQRKQKMLYDEFWERIRSQAEQRKREEEERKKREEEQKKKVEEERLHREAEQRKQEKEERKRREEGKKKKENDFWGDLNLGLYIPDGDGVVKPSKKKIKSNDFLKQFFEEEQKKKYYDEFWDKHYLLFWGLLASPILFLGIGTWAGFFFESFPVGVGVFFISSLVSLTLFRTLYYWARKDKTKARNSLILALLPLIFVFLCVVLYNSDNLNISVWLNFFLFICIFLIAIYYIYLAYNTCD